MVKNVSFYGYSFLNYLYNKIRKLILSKTAGFAYKFPLSLIIMFLFFFKKSTNSIHFSTRKPIEVDDWSIFTASKGDDRHNN